MGAFLEVAADRAGVRSHGLPEGRETIDGANFQNVFRFIDANENCYSKVTCPERFTLRSAAL